MNPAPLIQIPPGNLTLGRAPDNDMVLEHPMVSRYHARLIHQNGSLVIEDLKSANGVFIN